VVQLHAAKGLFTILPGNAQIQPARSFLGSSRKASSLSQLGEIEDGRKAATSLLKLTPDFAARGRMLIRRLIKFDEIVQRAISGLSKVGVEVDP
jgi:hypothetical protein